MTRRTHNELPTRGPGRPRVERGEWSPRAFRSVLASRGLSAKWVHTQLAARGVSMDIARLQGWARGADIPTPDADMLRNLASILGCTQRYLKVDPK